MYKNDYWDKVVADPGSGLASSTSFATHASFPDPLLNQAISFNRKYLPAATKLWPRLCFYSCLWFCPHSDIRSMSGRYASYWNAFLLLLYLQVRWHIALYRWRHKTVESPNRWSRTTPSQPPLQARMSHKLVVTRCRTNQTVNQPHSQ